MTDYKKYALGQVENFLYDAMSSGATPQEIYDVIKGVVEDNYYTYKKSASEAYELLALLNGNGVGHITNYDDTELMPDLQYTDEEIDAMCDAAEAKDKVNKWIIPVDDDYNITFPEDLLEQTGWKEGDVLEWIDQGDGSFKLIKKEKKEHPSWEKGNELARVKTYQEMIDDGWTMTDDGFWIKEN
jgi:bifunctional DNA-binding transcriptional regulator/antitoxin component of YhaV-PrlF toxin-antitoxin module